MIAADRQPAELEPVLCAGLALDRLVGRYPGRDQHHEVETELNVRLLAAYEVTKMWRIERPAEDPDAHLRLSARSRTDLSRALDQVFERAQLA